MSDSGLRIKPSESLRGKNKQTESRQTLRLKTKIMLIHYRLLIKSLQIYAKKVVLLPFLSEEVC